MKKTVIKVWVLTGDKIETAINIGVSCGLLDGGMDQYIIEESDTIDLQLKIKDIIKQIKDNVGLGRK